MNKKLFLWGIPIMLLLGIAGATAYTMLFTTSHINIVEQQDLQYEESGVWNSFPLNTGSSVDLTAVDIGAGDYQDFAIRGINPNKRDIQYTMVLVSPDANVVTDFVCSQSGVQYWKEVIGTTTTVKILNPATSTSEAVIRTTVDAGAPLTTDVQVTTTVDRFEVDTTVPWSVCP